MKFTEDFKARCKKAYPDWERLHEKLEEGSQWVGRYLDDSRESGIAYDEILSATSLEELKAKALLIKEQNDLYCDFVDGNCYEVPTVLNSEIKHKLVELMQKVFDDHPLEQIGGMHLPYLYLNTDGSVIETENTATLKEFMRIHQLGFQNELTLECFYYARQNYLAAHQKFNLNAPVIDDDGFTGKVVAYNPEANMYKIEHELVNGRLPVADGWYPPERLKHYETQEKGSGKEGLDSLIAAAQAISDQSAKLSNNLQKHKESLFNGR